MHMPAAAFRRLWLVICLTLLGGLVTTVPVNCVCDSGEHLGQPVHAAFPHTHPLSATSPNDDSQVAHTTDDALAMSSVDHGPALSSFESLASPQPLALLAIAALILAGGLRSRERLPMGVILARIKAPPRLIALPS